MLNATYTPHHRDTAEGHIFLGHGKVGAVTIGLVGAASMTQKELDFYGKIIAEALRNLSPSQQDEAAALAKTGK